MCPDDNVCCSRVARNEVKVRRADLAGLFLVYGWRPWMAFSPPTQTYISLTRFRPPILFLGQQHLQSNLKTVDLGGRHGEENDGGREGGRRYA